MKRLSTDFGTTLGVQDRTPIFLAIKVSLTNTAAHEEIKGLMTTV